MLSVDLSTEALETRKENDIFKVIRKERPTKNTLPSKMCVWVHVHWNVSNILKDV